MFIFQIITLKQRIQLILDTRPLKIQFLIFITNNQILYQIVQIYLMPEQPEVTYSYFYYICLSGVIAYACLTWLHFFGVKLNYGRMSFSAVKISLHPKLAWFLFEIPNLIWAYYFFINDSWLSLGYLLFIIHYINRCIIYPLRLKTQTKVPLQIVVSAFSFTFFNGYLQGISNNNQKIAWLLEPYPDRIGIGIFVVGMIINIYSDSILQQAKQELLKQAEKKKSDGIEPKSKYKKIDKFLFKYVGSPNYLGQIIQWFGYAIVCQTFQATIFAFTVLSLLTSEAINRNNWNKTNIPNYPPQRKAVIPFII